LDKDGQRTAQHLTDTHAAVSELTKEVATNCILIITSPQTYTLLGHEPNVLLWYCQAITHVGWPVQHSVNVGLSRFVTDATKFSRVKSF